MGLVFFVSLWLIAATAFTFEGNSLSGRSANHATWEERLVRYGRGILRTPFVQPRQPSYFKHRHFESQERLVPSLRIVQHAADILLELSAVLKAKFEWREAEIADVIRSVGYCSTLVKPQVLVDEIEDDPDNLILECAMEGGADFIVSGDHHLLDLGSYRGVRILKARDLPDIVLKS